MALDFSAMKGVSRGAPRVWAVGEAGLHCGYFLIHSRPHKTAPTLVSFGNMLPFKVPTVTQGCELILGHLQEVEKMCQPSYRKPAQAWLLSRKSYTCCSVILFLRSNSLYSVLYRNPAAPSEVRSNTVAFQSPTLHRTLWFQPVWGPHQCPPRSHPGWWRLCNNRFPVLSAFQDLEMTCSLSSPWGTLCLHLSNRVATSRVWPPGTCNMANLTRDVLYQIHRAFRRLSTETCKISH